MGNVCIKSSEESKVSKDYYSEYIKLCSRLNDFTCSTAAKVAKHNRAMDKLSRLYHEVEKEDKSFYLDLMNLDDERVKLTAAAHCLGHGIYIDKAISIVEYLDNHGTTPGVSLDAHGILYVLNTEGHLKF